MDYGEEYKLKPIKSKWAATSVIIRLLVMHLNRYRMVDAWGNRGLESRPWSAMYAVERILEAAGMLKPVGWNKRMKLDLDAQTNALSEAIKKKIDDNFEKMV